MRNSDSRKDFVKKKAVSFDRSYTTVDVEAKRKVDNFVHGFEIRLFDF